MINLIQLKEVLRNKRFIFFTILVPLFWFLSLKSINGNVDKLNYNWLLIDFVMAALMGILGNSLVTFGKRISDAREFYLLQSKVSNYSIWRFMKDSLLSQIVLNFIILFLTSIVALVTGAVAFNFAFLIIALAIMLFGIYISIIGFSLGMVFNQKLLDSAGFPLMILVAFLIVPFYAFSHSTVINIITSIQKLFPGYYFIQILNHLNLNIKLGLDPLWLFITFVITLLPFILLIWKKLG